MPDVICGRGRLGQRISAAMAARGRAPLALRIDAQHGLVAAEPLPLPTRIDSLVICLVPRHPDGGSGWLGLLAGLSKQVQRGELQIGRALLVSSTAVYSCHRSGWVTADSAVTPIDARTAGLIDAEQLTRTLAPETVVVRLAGITGPGYERFEPVAMSAQQPRHAVDVRAAADCVVALATEPGPVAATELLTDGYVYWQGKRFPAQTDQPELQTLASEHRLMRPSTIARI